MHRKFFHLLKKIYRPPPSGRICWCANVISSDWAHTLNTSCRRSVRDATWSVWVKWHILTEVVWVSGAWLSNTMLRVLGRNFLPRLFESGSSKYWSSLDYPSTTYPNTPVKAIKPHSLTLPCRSWKISSPTRVWKCNLSTELLAQSDLSYCKWTLIMITLLFMLSNNNK